MGFHPGRASQDRGRGPRPDVDPMLVEEAGAGTRRSQVRWGVVRVFGRREGWRGWSGRGASGGWGILRGLEGRLECGGSRPGPCTSFLCVGVPKRAAGMRGPSAGPPHRLLLFVSDSEEPPFALLLRLLLPPPCRSNHDLLNDFFERVHLVGSRVLGAVVYGCGGNGLERVDHRAGIHPCGGRFLRVEGGGAPSPPVFATGCPSHISFPCVFLLRVSENRGRGSGGRGRPERETAHFSTDSVHLGRLKPRAAAPAVLPLVEVGDPFRSARAAVDAAGMRGVFIACGRARGGRRAGRY